MHIYTPDGREVVVSAELEDRVRIHYKVGFDRPNGRTYWVEKRLVKEVVDDFDGQGQ